MGIWRKVRGALGLRISSQISPNYSTRGGPWPRVLMQVCHPGPLTPVPLCRALIRRELEGPRGGWDWVPKWAVPEALATGTPGPHRILACTTGEAVGPFWAELLPLLAFEFRLIRARKSAGEVVQPDLAIDRGEGSEGTVGRHRS